MTSTGATFAGTTPNSGNSLSMLQPFAYSAYAVSNAPSHYYRAGESASSSAGPAMADSSGNNRAGAYGARTDGAATWWKFDDISGGPGTTTADSSGLGATGTLTDANAGSTPQGYRGAAFAVGAGSGYVTGAPKVHTNVSFTMCAWARPTANNANMTVFSQVTTNTFGVAVRFNSGNWYLGAAQSDSASSPTVDNITYAATLNTWTHLCAVYDRSAGANGTFYLWVNGVQRGSKTRTTGPWDAFTELRAGRDRWNGANNYQFIGDVDDVRAYARALTEADLETMTDNGSGTANAGPTAKWDFGENTGTTVNDSSGNGRTATMSNASRWTATARNNYAFNSANTYRTSRSAFIDTDSDFTVSAWVNPSTAGAKQYAVVQSNQYQALFFTGGVNFELGIDAGGKWAFNMYDNGGGSGANSTPDAAAVGGAATTGWTYLVGTFQDSPRSLKLYVNGGLAGTSNGSGLSPWDSTGGTAPTTFVGHSGYTVPCCTGNEYYSYFTGQIDEVATYARELPAGEIHGLFYDTLGAALLAGQPGAFSTGYETGTTAVAFSGTTNAYSNASVNNPNPFTIHAFVKVTGGPGGAIIGFAGSPTGRTDTDHGRQLYVDSTGKLRFSIRSGGAEKTLASPGAINDGQWYHVAGSVGPAGMKLYLNGAPVASDPTTTADDNFTGYWRLGGTDLGGFTNRPSSDYLVGLIDEASVYPTQLSDTVIGLQYAGRTW